MTNTTNRPPLHPHRRPRGILLRDLLMATLLDAGPTGATRADVEATILTAGFDLPLGRPGKAISDAVTTEVRRRRVVRLDRGTFALARPLSRSERHRIRRRIREARAGRALSSHLA